MEGLRPNIAKDVIMRDNLPKTFSEAFGWALRFETKKQKIAKDKELPVEPTPSAVV